jgi:predicted kinase
MTVIHLICGAVGAGKTTYAFDLCDRWSAVHFWMDDWMQTLFSADIPALPAPLWVEERLRRCELQMVKMAIECGWRGIPSVLDMGFLRASFRHQVVDDITAAGLGCRLHVLDVSSEERWHRVVIRNTQQGESYRVPVSRALFDLIETIWEPPTPEEMKALTGVYVGAAPYACGQDTIQRTDVTGADVSSCSDVGA